ncbi:MAG TPA: type II toxin-antitoxin system VapC family toxin [Nitrospirota bacterium]
MGVIFDTSVLVTLERGSHGLEALADGRENEPFGISVVTVSELLHGVHRADSEKRRLKRSAFVEKVIQTFPVYPFDLSAARIYARVWANLAKKGTAIGAHDLMIASTAIALGYSVVTADLRDFGKIKEAPVEKLILE